MRRGFISGIIISLVIAAATLTFSGVGTAQGDVVSHSIWSGLLQGVTLATGTTANTNDTAQDNPAQNPSTGGFPAPASAAPQSSPKPAPGGYVALGDSVASGLGLPMAAEATKQDHRCGRSPQAYPYEVGRQLGKPVSVYACSAAKSGDLYTRQWIYNFNPRIQIDQAFANGTPDLISITIGANDIQWGRLVRQCYTGTCGTDNQTARVESNLITMQNRLNQVLQQIENRSNNTPPQVVLTGYYNPISESCTTLYPEHITSQEVQWVSNGVELLNNSLQLVAATHDEFVRYAAVEFKGHDICSDSPWVQGLDDSAPIHPTISGQEAIATAVVNAYRD